MDSARMCVGVSDLARSCLLIVPSPPGLYRHRDRTWRVRPGAPGKAESCRGRREGRRLTFPILVDQFLRPRGTMVAVALAANTKLEARRILDFAVVICCAEPRFASVSPAG